MSVASLYRHGLAIISFFSIVIHIIDFWSICSCDILLLGSDLLIQFMSIWFWLEGRGVVLASKSLFFLIIFKLIIPLSCKGLAGKSRFHYLLVWNPSLLLVHDCFLRTLLVASVPWRVEVPGKVHILYRVWRCLWNFFLSNNLPPLWSPSCKLNPLCLGLRSFSKIVIRHRSWRCFRKLIVNVPVLVVRGSLRLAPLVLWRPIRRKRGLFLFKVPQAVLDPGPHVVYACIHLPNGSALLHCSVVKALWFRSRRGLSTKIGVIGWSLCGSSDGIFLFLGEHCVVDLGVESDILARVPGFYVIRPASMSLVGRIF